MSFSQTKKENDSNFLLTLATHIQELQDLFLGSSVENLKDLTKKTEFISLEISKISLKIKQEQSKFIKQRLQKDFTALVSRFEKIVKDIQDKKFSKTLQNNVVQEDLDESTPLLQQSKQVVKLDNQIEFNQVLIQEREEDLQGIESSVAQVNEIFRDLGTLVHEQQYMLDNIESNVASVAVNAENATGELRRANQYAISSRKRILCLLSTALIVLLVLILLLRPWRAF